MHAAATPPPRIYRALGVTLGSSEKDSGKGGNAAETSNDAQGRARLARHTSAVTSSLSHPSDDE